MSEEDDAVRHSSMAPHPAERETGFAAISTLAVRRFLHTIVVVDDRATYRPADEIPAEVIEPDVGTVVDDDDPPIEAMGSGSELDVKELSDACADLGLTCAVLRPDEEDQHGGALTKRLLETARRADVLVLDWQLNDQSEGQAALELLMSVTRADEVGGDRLRLVCVYTSHPRLELVHERILERLDNRVQSSGLSASPPELSIDCGSLRVVVVGKDSMAESKAAFTYASEADLPDLLVSEFTRLTHGLVSNAAVASIGAVRDQAHRLLSRFGRSIDAAFLSHRAFEGGPESEEFAVRLIADEMKTILDAEDIRRWIGPIPVAAWADAHLPETIAVSGKVDGAVHRDRIRDVLAEAQPMPVELQIGAGVWASLGKGTYKDSITSLLLHDSANAGDHDHEFSRMTCMARNDGSSFPDGRVPFLTEGTLVHDDSADTSRYLFCVMPLCDTVRIDNPRQFPFVALRQTDADHRYDIAATDPDGQRLYLAVVSDKHYDQVQLTFVPSGNGVVEAARSSDDRSRFFFDTAAGSKLLWLGELRFQHAHRKAAQLSAHASRVGLDESHVLQAASRRRS